MKTSVEQPQIKKKTGRFQPGQSGNPGGRPKTAHFTAELREWLRGKVKGRERLEIALENLLREDPKVLLAYAFGKPVEHVEHSGSVVVGVEQDIMQRAREYASHRRN